MTRQDKFYLNVESDSFFKRNEKKNNLFFKNIQKENLRPSKKNIYKLISKTHKLNEFFPSLNEGHAAGWEKVGRGYEFIGIVVIEYPHFKL